MSQADPNYDPTNIDDEAYDDSIAEEVNFQVGRDQALIREHVITVRTRDTLEAIYHDGTLESAARIVKFLHIRRLSEGSIERHLDAWKVRVDTRSLGIVQDEWLLTHGASFTKCPGAQFDKRYERVEPNGG